MEEYTELAKKASGELWMVFKPRITADMSTDEFWQDLIRTVSDLVEKYNGTAVEGYVGDMAVFYLLQIQRIYRKDNKGVKYSEFKNAVSKMMKEIRNENRTD